MASKKEEVRACFDGLKARSLPKPLVAEELPEVLWRDGVALNATEIKHLVTVLREVAPGEPGEVVRRVSEELDVASAQAFSSRLLAIWEGADSPSGQKWMLFQRSVFATDAEIKAMCGAHDWTSLASSGKWARANWYLSVIAARGPSVESTKLFFDLLSTGTLDGTVQRASRDYLKAFAASKGMTTQDFLEDADLLGVFPTRELPFVAGEEVVEAGGARYVVGVHNGQLSFVNEATHKRLSEVPEELGEEDAARVATWQQIVHEEMLRWGGYLHYSMTLGRTFAVEVVQQWFGHPVAKGLLGSLLWKVEGSSQIVRLEPDEAFDVNYEAVAIEGEEKLMLVQISALPEDVKQQWYDHLSDNEMMLPFDVLQRDMYLGRINELLAAAYVELEDEVGDAIHSLYDHGYQAGHTEDGGCVLENYKTFPEFNVRVFLAHTGFDVSEGDRYEYPSNVVGVRYQDLFGQERGEQEVYISVLAEVAVDLAKIKHL